LRRVLLASFGFDVDYVLRRLSSQKYSRVVLLGLRTREGFERVKKAYSTLSIVCTSLKIDCVLEPIDPSNLVRSVYSTLLGETRGADEVEVYLTGGPRILVTALILSTLMLPELEATRIKLVVEGEGFECSMSISVKYLISRLRLDDRDKAILVALEEGRLLLSEVVKKTGLPKSTVHRRLEELVDKGLVVKTEAETYMAEPYVDLVCLG
jgi:CRISPR-associated protein Csa3